MKLRTTERQLLYDSDWSMTSVLGACQNAGIPPQKVVRAMSLMQQFDVPAERLPGALALAFQRKIKWTVETS